MCDTLTTPDGRELGTIADVKDLLGDRDVPVDPDYPPDIPEECCLCPVDLDKVCQMMGWRYRHDGMFGEHLGLKPGKPE